MSTPHDVGRAKFCRRRSLPGGWTEVVFAGDCDDENCPCGFSYANNCICPGPTEDGYEYEEIDGVMYGRRIIQTSGEA